jgi:formylglycine-generating enzyme required for sulfatase activity
MVAAGALLSGGMSSQAATGPRADAQGVAGQVIRDCPDACPEMVLVPAGEFSMGSPPTEDGRDPPEGPLHKVRIARSFLVGKYDVTVGQYSRFIAETHHDNGDTCNEMVHLDWRNPGFPQEDSSPVVCVNFVDAQAYAAWLSKRTGHAYRLLSEAEHEYVNRAGAITAFWWGPSVGVNNANCAGCGSPWDRKRTSPVGSFAPNPFGLYDTTGNVYVWVSDCWNDTYDAAPDDGSPNLKGDCTRRGLRGGGWGSGVAHVRAAFRLADPSGARHDNMGFRVARDR